MEGKRFKKVERSFYISKIFISFLLIFTLSLGSIITVTAISVPCLVVDGENQYEFSLIAPSQETVLEKAVEVGMPPLGVNDKVEMHKGAYIIKRAVTINIDYGFGNISVVAYKGDVLSDIINANDIPYYNSKDVVIPTVDTILSEDTEVLIKQYAPVSVNYEGEEIQTVMYGATVSDVLDNMGIVLAKTDVVSLEVDTYLKDEVDITVQAENTFSFTYMGVTEEVNSYCLTVGDFLVEKEIELKEGVMITPSPDTIISDDINVIVEYVENKEVSETHQVSYATTREPNGSLNIGETKTKTEGVNGEKEVVYSEKYLNGVLVERNVVSETITVQPVNKVIYYGTKVEQTTIPSEDAKTFIDHNGNEVAYASTIVGECTAYTATGNNTSLGQVPQVGIVAVNPDVIPYGTKMYITSNSVVYGYAVAGDTGGALLSNRVLVDLFYNTEEECVNFGRRDMTVYILE